MTADGARQARLEARLDPDVHALLKRAAEIEGRTLTDFVVAAALGAARTTIEQSEVLRLTGASAELVARLMEAPPPVTPAMERAADRHARLVGPL